MVDLADGRSVYISVSVKLKNYVAAITVNLDSDENGKVTLLDRNNILWDIQL